MRRLRGMGRLLRGAPALFLLFGLLAFGELTIGGGLAAQETDPEGPAVGLAIERYQIELEVGYDGAFEVTERLTFRPESGSFSFGSRSIPTRRMDRLSEISVESPDLQGLTVSSESGNRRRLVSWEHEPSPGPGTIVLRYRVEGALLDHGDRNEVFWAAVGSDGDLPVGGVEGVVRIPASFAAEPGEIRTEPDAEVAEGPEAWTLTFEHGALQPGQAYQIRVSFPWAVEGRVRGLRDPGVQTLLLGLILLLLGMVFGTWGYESWNRGKPNLRAGAPEVSIPEAAALLHQGLYAEQCYPALAVELGRRGHLTLVREGAGEDEAVGTGGTPDVRLEVHPRDDDPLSDFEQAFLEDLEPFASLEAFGKEGSDVRGTRMAALRRGMVDDGWFLDRSEERKATGRLGLGLLAVSVLLPVGVVLGDAPIRLFAVAAGGFGLALGMLIRSEQKRVPSPRARDVQAELRGWLQRLREELDRTLQRDPVEAAVRYLDVLPWLILDPRHSGAFEPRLRRALREAEGDLPVPDWIRDRYEEKGAARERIDRYTAPYRSFHSVQETTAATAAALVPLLASSTGVGGGSATASVVTVGATGGGAAGGGGVSAG